MKKTKEEIKDGLGHEFAEGPHALGCFIVGVILMIAVYELFRYLIHLKP
jgi:hypothetical protein